MSIDPSIRLQKFLAEAGIASRRAGERLITEGRVLVNGQQITTLGAKVNPAVDRVSVDGKEVKTRRKIYLALNKPPGLVCSRKDELGRPTVYDILPREWGHLHTVGRLDCASEGLLFLTNDGAFSLHLTHPRYGIRKQYLVTLSGRVEHPQVQKLTEGIYDEGERLKAERARILSATKSRSTVELELAEGKNREVRRMFECLGLHVERLQRTRIGRIQLGQLRPGKWRTLTEPEIKSLLS